MGQFHWDPDGYLEIVRAEVPDYDRVQDELARATEGIDARRVLELGTGTGVTVAARPRTPSARAADRRGLQRAHARRGRPAGRRPAPAGPARRRCPRARSTSSFSALAIHHLDGPSKADLFARVAAVLAPGGRFVLADVVVPEDPADVVTPLDAGFDLPDTVPDLLRWMGDAGLRARVSWQARDLAVLVADAAVSSTSAGQTATT